MADFCRQCSVELFNEDFRDLAGLCTQEDNKNGKYTKVLCEGCGPCLVDCAGVCQGGCMCHEHAATGGQPARDKRTDVLLFVTIVCVGLSLVLGVFGFMTVRMDLQEAGLIFTGISLWLLLGLAVRHV